MRREARRFFKVLRIILAHPGHPTGRFYGTGCDVMVRILFVVRPWIVTDDCIHLQEPEEEDEPQP